MAYILVEKKRFARVWNIQPSEHWPLRKWILEKRATYNMSGWPVFWWLWRIELSIDSDVYSDGKRVNGWSVSLATPWAMASFYWKHPYCAMFMDRKTSAEFSWQHRKGWPYSEGDLMFLQTRKKTWRTWSFRNRLTQVKLTDIC